MKKIVIDLDDTICFPNKDADDSLTKYGKAIPNWPVIDKLKEIKSKDFYIIIHTARRMVTHSGNIEKIMQDVQVITSVWLDKHGVPYDELIFGKPYSDTYYVDDKNISIKEFIEWEI
jgi:capsule biosynthesis phosphatase